MVKTTKEKNDKDCVHKISQLKKRENQSCAQKLSMKVLIQVIVVIYGVFWDN